MTFYCDCPHPEASHSFLCGALFCSECQTMQSTTAPTGFAQTMLSTFVAARIDGIKYLHARITGS